MAKASSWCVAKQRQVDIKKQAAGIPLSSNPVELKLFKGTVGLRSVGRGQIPTLFRNVAL